MKNNEIKVKIKRLSEKAKIPTYGSDNAAGCDLYACIDGPVIVPPHQTVKIGTGIAIEIPKGYYGELCARSGLATKFGLRLANGVGVIDADYRGEYIVAIHNDSNTEATISPNERIAQLLFKRYWTAQFEEVEELSDTCRGSGGFGSTGK